MGEDEVKAEVIYSVRLDKLEGRKLTVTKWWVDDLKQRVSMEDTYELAEDSEKTPEQLIPYLGTMVNITIVNGEVYNVESA